MSDDSLIGQLAEEFTRKVREGKLPDIDEYASRYPELAERILELFPTLMLLEGMAATSDSAAAETLPSGLAAGFVFGQYRIEREIGRGGMGIVYEATHVLLEKRVALKILPVRTPVDAAHLERFFREARTAAGLHHTNIVPVFDVGQASGTPYYAMQYIEGRGLDRIIKLMQPAAELDVPADSPSAAATGESPLESPAAPITKSTASKEKEARPPRQSDPSGRIRAGLPGREEDYFRWVAGIGIQAAEGLAYAHERKVVHRDIKPSNLLLDNEGVLWIADFGLARRIEDPAMTQSGMLIGTPRYMSPEQAEAAKRPIDQRSDIYSLGVTLYELLTCRAVFEGKTPQEVLSQILAREPVAPRRLNSSIPADLETVVMKAMAKRPEDRYQSAQELAGDLQHWLRMEPIHARRIGPLGRTVRWCHRNPRLAAVTAVAVAIIFALSGVYYRSLLRENADTRAALQLANRQSYEANLTAADLNLNFNRTQEALRRLLLCDPALRGWEWRHLFLKTDSSLASLNARGNFDETPYLMSRFAFSADGTRFFWNTQFTLGVWDSATNQPLAMYSGFGPILAITGDGTKILAYASKQKALRVLDPVSGRVLSTLAAKSEAPTSSAFSPDGKRIATYNDGTLSLWDTESGKNLAQTKGHKEIRCLAFTPDGTRIVSGSMAEMQLWDATTCRPVIVFKGNDADVSSIAFSHDGMRVSAGSRKGHVQVWDVATGKPVAAMTGHDGPVWTVAYSRDDSQIASGGYDSTVRLWDANSGKEIASLTGHYDQPSVNSVAFTPNGSRILSGAQFGGGNVRIWNIDKAQGFTNLKGHEESIECVDFSPDGNRIVSGSDDKTLRIWDAESGHAKLTLKGHDNIIKSVAFSPDGRRIVSGSVDKTVRLWDAHSGKTVITFSGHSATVNSVAFSPDGTRIASGSEDKTVRVWDAFSGRLVTTITLLERVNAVAFSPDGARILSGSGDPSRMPNEGRSVQGWDAVSGSNLFSLNLEGYPENVSAVSSVAFSRDGKRIAAAFTGYSEIGIWDANSGKKLAALEGHRGPLTAVAFSPDCGRIISGGWDGTVRVWDASSYESLLTLTGPGGGVHSVAFSPDGTRIASGYSDKTIRIWDSRSAYYPENPETVKLVASLFEQFTFAGDVIQHLQNDAKLDPDLRKAALQLAQRRGDNPRWLNDRSWSTVKSPGGSPEAYRLALRMSEVASRIAPWDRSYLSTLGVAQYRTGAYQDAIVTLMHSEEMGENPAATDIAFLAMARFKLGQTGQARADLEQLRTLMKDPDRSSDPELQGFLHEAEALIAVAEAATRCLSLFT